MSRSSYERRLIESLRLQGCTDILSSGWPDLLVRGGDGTWWALEVKSPSDTIKRHQTEMHRALAAAGMRVAVVRFSGFDPGRAYVERVDPDPIVGGV